MLKGNVMIVGVGNVLRGDDGLGPYMVKRLQRKLEVPCINAGSSLDRYIGKIMRENPDTVLIIDAAQLGENPGAYEVLGFEQLLGIDITTHHQSPRMLLDMLTGRLENRIYYVGVQPESIDLREGISKKLKKPLRILENKIVAAARGQTQKKGGAKV